MPKRARDGAPVRVLIACEFSGVVRDAFAARGHDAWSADLLASERPAGQHYVGDVREVIEREKWDLLIGHPPCTALAVSGARWFKSRRDEQAHALGFALQLMAADVPRIAIENPVSILSSHIRRPDCIVHPWQHGHGEVKATCFWLKGLPPLQPSQIVDGRVPRVHLEAPGPDRWKNRSRTLPGIAAAMADQWGRE